MGVDLERRIEGHLHLVSPGRKRPVHQGPLRVGNTNIQSMSWPGIESLHICLQEQHKDGMQLGGGYGARM